MALIAIWLAVATAPALPGVGAPAFRDAPIVVAIAEFEAEAAAEHRWVGRSFSTSIVTSLSRAGDLRLVERQFIDKVVDELKLQASGLVDPVTAARAGRLLGADVLVVGSVSVAGEMISARARVVRVDDGGVLGGVEVEGRMSELFGLQRQLATRLAGTLAPLGIAMTSDVAAGDPPLELMRELQRVSLLAEGMPFFGQDPARRRRAAEYQLVLATLDRIVSRHPDFAQAQYYRALFSLQADDMQTATLASGAAAELAPADVDVRLLQSNLLYLNRLEDEALEVLGRIVAEISDEARAWYAIGRIQTRERRHAEAVVAFVRALGGQPWIPEAETNLRTLVAGPEGERLVRALAAVDSAAAQAAALYRAHWTGDDASAARLAQGAVVALPHLYIGYYRRAVADARAGREAEAFADFRLTLALQPGFAPVHRELAFLHAARGECARALDHARMYLALASFVDDFARVDATLSRCR